MQETQSISLMSTRVRVLVMAGTLLGMFTAAMDQTIVGTAMPRVVASLGGLEHYSWVFTSFMVVSTTTVPIVGKLTDLFGRKFFFLGGIAIMMMGSALAGTSQSMIHLIMFRAVQGLGAGMIMSTAFAIVGDVFPPAQRARWTGLMAGVFAAASVIGPLIGGYITDNLNWRWVFYVNLPMGGLALTLFFTVMPSLRPQGPRPRVDYLGVSMLIAAVVPLLLAFSWAGQDYPWASPQIIGLLVFSAVAAMAFALIETRAEEPIISPALFRSRVFVVAAIVTFLTGMGMFGAIAYIPLFVQGVIGSSATNSGLVTMPMMLTMAATAAVVGQIMARWGGYRVIGVVGLSVMTFGVFMMSRMDADTTNVIATRNMVIVGLGLGSSMPLFMLMVQNALPYHMLGTSTASIQFFRSVGGTMGVAIMGSMLNNRFRSELTAQTPAEVRQSVPADLLAGLQNPQSLLNEGLLESLRGSFAQLGDQGSAMFDQVMEATRTSLAVGIADAFIISVGVTAASVAVAFFMREVPLRKSYGPPVLAEAVPFDPPAAETDNPLDVAFAPVESGRAGRVWPVRLLALAAAAVAALVLALLRARNHEPPAPP